MRITGQDQTFEKDYINGDLYISGKSITLDGCHIKGDVYLCDGCKKITLRQCTMHNLVHGTCTQIYIMENLIVGDIIPIGKVTESATVGNMMKNKMPLNGVDRAILRLQKGVKCP